MKLTMRKSGEDWYVIERSEHDGRSWLEAVPGLGPNCMAFMTSARFSDADVEGTLEEMVAIAEAIEKRDSVSFKRCAVRIDGSHAFFQSPRNSMREGECTVREATELAAEIRRVAAAAAGAA